ncbi:MAG: PA0069 family radical SAM protein [Cyclobacteriaceae bacterium]
MEYIKGRGAQFNQPNSFLKNQITQEHTEAIDEPVNLNENTKLFDEYPRNIVNKVNSPDLGNTHYINPYQGCEHGCVYCYARNTHQYWGYSAGLDFENKIIVKKNAPQLLEKYFNQKNYQPHVINMAGNTDCYQPAERKLEITRNLLKIFLKYGNPVGLITKNSMILRDLDILKELARDNLVRVMISVTASDEEIRRKMEPRTASYAKRLEVISTLTNAGIPTGVMLAPIIPGLTNYEIPAIIKNVAEAGALKVAYTMVRLNGEVQHIFRDWLLKNFPDRAAKVWNQIAETHGGKVNDSQWGRRLKGDGILADSIKSIFAASVKRFMPDREFPDYNLNAFRPGGNLRLF